MSDNPPAVGHADSINSRDSGSNATEKKKSRRPANTAFRQQRLKAWQPILTPKTVLPLFFAIGIIFAPIGGLLLYASATVQEIRLDYTDCWKDARPNANGTNSTNTQFSDMPAGNVHTAFKSYANISASANAQWATTSLTEVYQGLSWNTSICSLKFSIPESMGPPVLLYYHLTKFYQNHRRYVASFSSQQLKGDALDAAAINKSSCTPLQTNASGVPYYPCGLIANSLFNDSISSPVLLNTQDDQPSEYNMQNRTDIAWGSDSELYGKTSYKANEVAPPPNWAAKYPNGYQSDDELPDLTNPAFMVWMRTAGLPEFSKLSRRNDNESMLGGTYRLDIVDRFASHTYGGTKSIILTTKTVMGGRNPFLGIAYVTVGGVCIILGAIFTVTHLIKPRKLGDHTYLSWNNTPASKPAAGPSTGMATGRDMRPGDVA